MCGLFGWSLSEEAMKEGDVKLLAAFLGTEMDTRGGDSWGVALPLRAELYRGLGRFERGKVISKILHPVVLGHTRKATTGSITIENAHPFVIGNTVGAHNGIIYNDDDMNEKYKRKFAVDSMHLIAHIDENKSVSEISGYGAVSYYKKNKPEDLYLAKGTSGEMNIIGLGTHKNPVGLVYASTSFALTKALQIAGFERYFFYNVRSETLYKVHDYTLFIEGDFPFGSHFTKGKTPVSYSPDCSGYRGRTAQDYLGEKKDQVVGVAGQILNCGQTSRSSGTGKSTGTEADVAIAALPTYDYSSSKVLDLPEDVKKTQEILLGRDKKATEMSTRRLTCYGCQMSGPACGFYAESPDAVVYDYTIGHAFCKECHGFWGLNNGDSVALTSSEQKALQAQLRPRLSVVRKEDDGNGTSTCRTIGYL